MLYQVAYVSMVGTVFLSYTFVVPYNTAYIRHTKPQTGIKLNLKIWFYFYLGRLGRVCVGNCGTVFHNKRKCLNVRIVFEKLWLLTPTFQIFLWWILSCNNINFCNYSEVHVISTNASNENAWAPPTVFSRIEDTPVWFQHKTSAVNWHKAIFSMYHQGTKGVWWMWTVLSVNGWGSSWVVSQGKSST